MMVQAKKNFPAGGNGVLIGLRFVTHDDGPVEVEDKKASELIRQGLVVAVVKLPAQDAQRAVAPKLEAQRR